MRYEYYQEGILKGKSTYNNIRHKQENNRETIVFMAIDFIANIYLRSDLYKEKYDIIHIYVKDNQEKKKILNFTMDLKGE